MGQGGIACPKPTPRRILKARRKRQAAKVVKAVRAYVFEREGGMCRCCVTRRAESMHEIIPRSLGGEVSRTNSIAVCGDGTCGCHGKLQRHEIRVEMGSKNGAEGLLYFTSLCRRIR